MKTIWKFELRLTDDQAVEMPAGAELLTVQLQGDTPCLWAVVDPYAPPGRRRIYIRGTGHSLRLTDDTRYLGTVQLHGGILVLHYFDGGEEDGEEDEVEETPAPRRRRESGPPVAPVVTKARNGKAPWQEEPEDEDDDLEAGATELTPDADDDDDDEEEVEEEYEPPPNPAKVTDARFGEYQARYGDESWELDALDPATITELIRANVEGLLEREAWEAGLEREAEHRRCLTAVAERWDDVVGGLD